MAGVVWIVGGVVLAVICVGLLASLFLKGTFKPGNRSPYSVANTEVLPNSPLSGKTILFLGSSVTKGLAALGESFVDYLQKRNSCTCVKEAVSATTVLDNGKNSYVQRMLRLNKGARLDAFVCQLSTNDTHFYGLKRLGDVSSSTNRSDFDTKTTTGAIEFIISYARETWNCPVIFFTNTYFNDKNYKALVDRLHEIKDKWGIGVIDLYNDRELNNISKKQLDFYMLRDHLHPVRAGYELWWTPAIERHLYDLIGNG
jgi:lysophospholipase L1-like esterase